MRLERRSSLREKVFEFLKNLPRGKVITYGELAKIFGTSPRAIGRILHSNKDPSIPCYKVVFADGKVSDSYVFGGKEGQIKRLKAEGVEIDKKGRVVSINTKFQTSNLKQNKILNTKF